MSTQFSTLPTSEINDVGGQLDEMLKKLGMSMESAPMQPIPANNMAFTSLGNTNPFISGFMQQPTMMQPNYNMNLKYNQPPYQPSLLPDQSVLVPPLNNPTQPSINFQNVSDSLASLQYSLSNMISMSSNFNSYPVQNTMLDTNTVNLNTLTTFIPPMGLSNLGTSNNLIGQNSFYSPQLSPIPSNSPFFVPTQTSPLPDPGFMGTQSVLDNSLIYGDNHLSDLPPGLNHDLHINSNELSPLVPFEFDLPALNEVNSALLEGIGGSKDDTLVASSLLMEGLLIDQDVPEDSTSSLSPNKNTKSSTTMNGKSPRDAHVSIDDSRSNSPSPVHEQHAEQVITQFVPPVVVVTPEPEKPSGPKPFSWADITKTTAAPTTTAVSSTTTTVTSTATSTTTTTTTTVSNNSSTSNSTNNSNNKNSKNTSKVAMNQNANKGQVNNNAIINNKNNTNNSSSTSNKNALDDKSKKPLPVIDNLDLSTINSPNFNCNPTFAKFFVIKSYSEDDIHKSIKYGIWTSTESGNKRLDRGYRECAGKGPVYLFFSVNSSGQFCGLAEMTSPLDYSKKASCWNEDKWSGQFTVSWKIIKDIQNVHLRHIKLTNNENKPVTNSRDTQEVYFQPGLEVLQIFHRFQSKNSILDDFSYYNECEKELKGQPTVK